MSNNIYTSEFHSLLKVPAKGINEPGKKIKPLMVRQAVSFSSGTEDKKHYHNIFNHNNFTISMAKPGKEKFLTTVKYKNGLISNNPNDMRPTIFENGIRQVDNGTFTAIFQELQNIWKKDEDALELMACLLYRNAFVLDHKFENGNWIYSPPKKIVDEITNRIPFVYNVPIIVFIHYLEGLAWNEDVKYHTLGHDIHTGVGRRNNLLTCVHLIAVFLNRASIVKFAGGFARPPAGLSAISQKLAIEIFPLLNPELNP